MSAKLLDQRAPLATGAELEDPISSSLVDGSGVGRIVGKDGTGGRSNSSIGDINDLSIERSDGRARVGEARFDDSVRACSAELI